jgi:hypothetical protein
MRRSSKVVRRCVGLVLVLVALPLVRFAPAAEATGAAVCTISGTITFSPSSVTAARGSWAIEPAVIDCHGLFRSSDRILGPGRFAGSGSYTAVPQGSGPCLQWIGSGTVDYVIPTSEQDVHLTEPHSFVLAGAGSFTTPTLRGPFQVTSLEDADCVTKPVTTALFVAQVVLVRFRAPQVSTADVAEGVRRVGFAGN